MPLLTEERLLEEMLLVKPAREALDRYIAEVRGKEPGQRSCSHTSRYRSFGFCLFVGFGFCN